MNFFFLLLILLQFISLLTIKNEKTTTLNVSDVDGCHIAGGVVC